MENELQLEVNSISDSEVLDIAMEIGVRLLKSGAEISRVEETVEYICRAYGATQIDCFAIPNMIIATIERDEKSYSSKLKRNYKMGNDFNAIEEYNSLSRYIVKNKPSLEEVKQKIKEIKKQRVYPFWLILIGAFFGAFGCTMFFGGTIRDSIAAGLVGIIVYLVSKIKASGKYKTVVTLIASLIGGLLSSVLCLIGLGENVGYIIMGAVMMLIPGIFICTSLKDILYGDVLSGSTRLIQAAALSLAIAAGFSIWPIIFGMDVEASRVNPFYMTLIASALASAGFTIVFNAKKNKILVAAIGGVLSCGVYLLARAGDLHEFFCVFLAVFAGAIYAEILARVIKAPAVVMMFPSIFALIPGGTLFNSMVYLIGGYSDLFRDNIILLGIISLAIAVGIIASQVVAILIKEIRIFMHKKRQKA